MTPKSKLQLLLLFILFITGHPTAMSRDKDKFDWYATESAPKHYPMKVIQGTFIYKGETERGLYIPSGGTLVAGWGRSISSHVSGEKFKPLPDRLNIIFFSNAENQFYEGEFTLPYDKILPLFEHGVATAKHPDSPMASFIMAGIAPGGAVSVWVGGPGDYTEVFFGYAEKVDLDHGAAFALPFKNKEQADAYIAKQLVNVLTPEELSSLKKNGIPFGLWERYRKKYTWVPVLKDNQIITSINANFVNGELERQWRGGLTIESVSPKPVPTKVAFHTVLNNKKVIYEVHFDEAETMAAFEKLGKDDQAIHVEFTPTWPRKNTTVRVYNDKESLQLKKIVSDDW